MQRALDEASVRHVARLARLQLTDEEVTRFAGQLTSILAYFEQLERLDTRDVEPFIHPIAVRNVLRDDAPRPSWDAAGALLNAPDRQDDFFRVPKVLEQGDA
jgi:aspartyl/glutamyl-tRNA(Asn/Gln) amidotransferase C subunit